MKSNSNAAILKTLVKRGAGMDIVSGGELYRALRAGCAPSRIVYASVGKRPDEIKEAIARGILLFNAESERELGRIDAIARAMRRKAAVALRLNPDVDSGTHKYITTGKSENKFGIDFDSARRIFRDADKYPGLDISGVHVHIGSQITKPEPFVKAVKKTLKFIDANGLGRRVKYFNMGGGMGIVYSKEHPQSADSFARRIKPLLRNRKFKLIIEPGRFIVGNAGILLTRVVYVKRTRSGKRFAIVDAGMNDLMRPSLYGSYHEIVPVIRRSGTAPKAVYDIVGPICESSDFLGLGRRLPVIEEGDLLAVMGAGAYGFSMSSTYNSRPRASEVMVVGKKPYVVRRRESRNDIVRGEKVPPGV